MDALTFIIPIATWIVGLATTTGVLKVMIKQATNDIKKTTDEIMKMKDESKEDFRKMKDDLKEDFREIRNDFREVKELSGQISKDIAVHEYRLATLEKRLP